MAGNTPDALFDLPPLEPAPDSKNDHPGAAAGNEHASSTSGRVSYPTPDQSQKPSSADSEEDSVRFDLGYDRPPPKVEEAKKQSVGRRRQTRPRQPRFIHSSDWYLSDKEREIGARSVKQLKEVLDRTRPPKPGRQTHPPGKAAPADKLHGAVTDEPF